MGVKEQKQWHHRGQFICQDGTMITAKHVNAAQYQTNGDGKHVSLDEYYVSRGPMGRVGNCTNTLCKECITPGCALAHHLFHSWPDKLELLPDCVRDAFDGSKCISYTNMLVAFGNGKEDGTVTDVLNTERNVIKRYLHEKARTMLHTDKDNKGPCVALFFEANKGFNYHFLTLDVQIKAPSGTVLLGEMQSLLHAVGGGTGLCFTLVYVLHSKTRLQVLAGAKRSKKDADWERKAEKEGKELETAIMYNFR